MSLCLFDIMVGCTDHGEVANIPAFPLRLRDERLRELVREVAVQSGISQNELIEQAVEHEMVARGRLLTEDLHAAACRLAELTDEQYQRILDRSADRFVAGEGQPDPLQARQLPSTVQVTTSVPADRFGVRTAFAAAEPQPA